MLLSYVIQYLVLLGYLQFFALRIYDRLSLLLYPLFLIMKRLMESNSSKPILSSNFSFLYVRCLLWLFMAIYALMVLVMHGYTSCVGPG